jgi:hypothetical protein
LGRATTPIVAEPVIVLEQPVVGLLAIMVYAPGLVCAGNVIDAPVPAITDMDVRPFIRV